ncbi:MAG: TetR/AcrR family transcriptional regulator [Flavobacteriales bacterium]|nr:TetR/AcrR family transcriptional regulator [Flavobacteriales bacterium]
MLEHLTASVKERMQAVALQETLPEPRLRAMFDSHFSYFKAHPEYLMAIFATNFMERTPAGDRAIKELMEVMRQHLRIVIGEGQKSGDFTRTIPADMLVHIVMGTFRLHMLQWRMSGRGFDITRKGRSLMDAVITLIGTKR